MENSNFRKKDTQMLFTDMREKLLMKMSLIIKYSNKEIHFKLQNNKGNGDPHCPSTRA